VHARSEQRAAIARVAESRGRRFDGLWLEAPGDRMAARIAARRNDVSDATPAVLQAQLAYDLGPIAWARISAAGDRDSVAAAAWRCLASP
jgi:predicted kinase